MQTYPHHWRDSIFNIRGYALIKVLSQAQV